MPARRKRPKSKPKSQRKWKKKNADPTIVICVLLAINLVAGLIWSPVTALRKVRVVGATPSQQELIQRAINRFSGVQRSAISVHAVESEILTDRSLRSAKLEANLFGRGVLKVVQKEAVARLTVPDGMVLAADGSVFLAESASESLPELSISPSFLKPVASPFSLWHSGSVAHLSQQLVKNFPEYSWIIVVTDQRQLQLDPTTGAIVVLGTFENLDEKLSSLASILRQDPDILEERIELNLISAKNPAKRQIDP